MKTTYEYQTYQRFMSKVTITPTGCWEWTGGATNKDGYGVFSVKGRPVQAHRWIWEFHCGPIEEGKCVLHACDNPTCVFIGHLGSGTHKENMEQMRERNRWKRPPVQYVLSDADANKIRRMWRNGEGWSQADLARRYGVTRQTIGDIVHKRSHMAKLCPHRRPGVDGDGTVPPAPEIPAVEGSTDEASA